MTIPVYRIAFGVVALGIVGCAALAGAPPSPPLAEPIAGGSTEHRWLGYRWAPGVALVYNVTEFTETRTGNRTATTPVQHVFRLEAVERTARGLIRVRAIDGETALFDVFLNEEGFVEDATALTAIPAAHRDTVAKTIVSLWQHPLMTQFARTVFPLGETRQFQISWSDLGYFSQFISGPPILVTTTFTGIKRLDAVEVIEMRSSVMPGLPMTIQAGPGRRAEITAASGDRIEYLDRRSGLMIAIHETFVFVTSQSVVRATSLTRLDRAASRGI